MILCTPKRFPKAAALGGGAQHCRFYPLPSGERTGGCFRLHLYYFHEISGLLLDKRRACVYNSSIWKICPVKGCDKEYTSWQITEIISSP